MGFMDKVKSQATSLAEKAQEGARAGQGKLSSMQAKHRADALLLELGGLYYLARADRATPADETRTEQLLAELSAHEAVNGPVVVSPAVAPPGDTGSYLPGTPPLATVPAATVPAGPATFVPSAASGPGSFQGGVPQAVPDAVGSPAQDDREDGPPGPSTLP
ncbi:MAG TPA: hypothetical protein VFN61_04915 [Acidimicrobiales bacterium]|nr:hypothetical protein [Acidimicrobiales bacterium]